MNYTEGKYPHREIGRSFRSLRKVWRLTSVRRGILEEIIGRAAMDIQFRQEMLEDPETALEEYKLTAEQITALKAIPADALERFAHR